MSRGGLDTGDDSRPSPVADLLRKRRFLKRSACGLKRSVSVKRTTLDKSIGRLSFGLSSQFLSDGGSSSHTDAPASRIIEEMGVSARCSAVSMYSIRRFEFNRCQTSRISLSLTLQVGCAHAPSARSARSRHLEIATSLYQHATPSPLILSSRSCSGPSPLDASIDLCGCSPSADASPSSLPPSADSSFKVPRTAPQLLPLCLWPARARHPQPAPRRRPRPCLPSLATARCPPPTTARRPGHQPPPPPRRTGRGSSSSCSPLASMPRCAPAPAAPP